MSTAERTESNSPRPHSAQVRASGAGAAKLDARHESPCLRKGTGASGQERQESLPLLPTPLSPNEPDRPVKPPRFRVAMIGSMILGIAIAWCSWRVLGWTAGPGMVVTGFVAGGVIWTVVSADRVRRWDRLAIGEERARSEYDGGR